MRRVCRLACLVALAGCGSDSGPSPITTTEAAAIHQAFAGGDPFYATIFDSVLARAGTATSVTVRRSGNDSTSTIALTSPPQSSFVLRVVGLQLDLDVVGGNGPVVGTYTGLLAWRLNGSSADITLFLLGADDTLGTYLFVGPNPNLSGFRELALMPSRGSWGGLGQGMTILATNFGPSQTVSATALVRSVSFGAIRTTAEFRVINAQSNFNWLAYDLAGGIPAVRLVMRGTL